MSIKSFLSGRCTTAKVLYLYAKMLLTPCGKEFASLKNKYKGKDVYVLGTGPSLTVDDIEKIKEHGGITISVNGIFYFFDQTDWRPDYYFFSDVNMDVEGYQEYYKMFKKRVSCMPIVIYNKFYWHDKCINNHMIPYKTNIVKNVLHNSMLVTSYIDHH